MTDLDALDPLARLAGIEDGWWDFFGTWRVVPAETKRVFLAAMGIEAGDAAAMAASLRALETRAWRRWLEPVTVLGAEDMAPSVVVTVPAAGDKQLLRWRVTEEAGAVHDGAAQVDTLVWREETWLDGALIKRWSLPLPAGLPLGYHRLDVTVGAAAAEVATVIVAPPAAYVPPPIADGGKVWGIATQLYALRGEGDWGVGTYRALGELAAGAAALGAATVGVNPLHALFPGQPERFSPYAPSSRRLLNLAYLDLASVPEFAACAEARARVAAPAFQAERDRLAALPLVDYPALDRLRRPVLDILYRWFRTTHLAAGDARAAAFRRFQAEGGRAVEHCCRFDALSERLPGYWRMWPADYRHPDAPAVAVFAEANRERVEFFWWLQFVADEQLGAAHRAGLAAGAALGLYRDLGVGIAGDGADAWAQQDCLALGVSVGAPPDPLALKGQDWGLLPFNPLALREAAYRPFAAMIAANMRHAGALRLDHAMALARLYWVPPGASAEQGAYVRYPVEDLCRVVALESHRQRCLVIGEDLGTVPEGFRERMGRMALFAYRVMIFEREGDQSFRRPEAFDEQALAIFTTHDLPSLRGWWRGADIERREALDLFPRPGMADEERAGREADRARLVAALAGQGLLDAGFPPTADLDDDRAEALALAVNTYLGRARARLAMVQIEDVLALDTQMNLPGTVDQYPNWRHRFPVSVAAVLADPRLGRLADRLAPDRRR